MPRPSKDAKHRHIVSVMLTKEQLRALELWARQQGRTKSGHLRYLSVAEMEQHGVYRLADDPDANPTDRGKPREKPAGEAEAEEEPELEAAVA